ncbi:hypothetical protein [Arcticibacter tournemirensis]
MRKRTAQGYTIMECTSTGPDWVSACLPDLSLPSVYLHADEQLSNN